MCNFFSFCMDEFGKKYYFNWEQRAIEKDGADSHDHIIAHYKLLPDKINCFEYNPLTRVFETDNINTIDNRVQAERWAKRLDFKKIIEPLIIKPIVNPFALPPVTKPTKAQVALLKKWASVGASVWASVWASVRASVGDSVWDSVGASVWASVWDSVGASVWDSVWASVRDSVGASVWDSVWDSVGASVRDSVGAYSSSFFAIPYKYDFSPAVKLWETGLVPSYDGKTWRLHSGIDAKIVYEWTQ